MTMNLVRRAVVTTALAAGMLAAVAGTAHASPGPASGTVSPPGMDLPMPDLNSGPNTREGVVDPNLPRTSLGAPAAMLAAQRSAMTILTPGGQQLYSTWFWGATRLCATSAGGPGTLTVQSTSPAAAGPEDLYIGSGSTQCIDRWWFGVPVWAINSGNVTLAVSTH
jgi:hypothetical protein